MKDGALYELVGRGNKDVYFINNTMTAYSPFRNNYNRIPASIHELRKVPPINNCDFGKVVEFEIEVAGDLFTHPTLLIDLPSWLPPEQKRTNPTSVIQDLSGVSYGYTSGIGYFLFEKIQLFQDQILLQEFSGDSLYATQLSKGSLNSSFLINSQIGLHDGSAISISRNGSNTLRVELPLLGCQHLEEGGFPSYSLRNNTFKLRLTVKKVEDLIEASDGRVKPNVWNRTFQQKLTSAGSFTQFQTVERYKMDSLTIYLETRHIYVEESTQKKLVETPIELTYSRLYENNYFFNEKEYAGSVPTITRRIDAVHPASRMLFFLRQKSDILANRLWKITSDLSSNEYYTELSFLIGSRDRETLFSPLVWNIISQHAKEDRYSGAGLGVMSWDLGEQRSSVLPRMRIPEGSVNFSVIDKPTLLMELEPLSATNKNTEMIMVVDTWGIYEMDGGNGGMKYAN